MTMNFQPLQIVVAGLGLPWLGYLTGLLLALAFKQPVPDMMAISVETGVHNTGISIFMLRAALSQPEADLTTGKGHVMADNSIVFGWRGLMPSSVVESSSLSLSTTCLNSFFLFFLSSGSSSCCYYDSSSTYNLVCGTKVEINMEIKKEGHVCQ